MAGAEGLEPSTKVLETHVLPLHHAPMFSRTGFIIQEIRSFVNTQVSILRLLFASPRRTRGMACAARLNGGRPGAGMQALLGALLRNLEADPAYNFLRGEPEFRAMIAEYQSQSEP